MKEKSAIEKNAAEKQVELLSSALGNAAEAGGYWLNTGGKQYPRFYPKGVAVNPFNALVMGLHSDKTGSQSNLFTLYSEAKARGASVREREQGVPFLFYNWNKYVNRHNPSDIISRTDYTQLPLKEQESYKGVRNREVRTVFTIDQTLLPLVDKAAYDKVMQEYGGNGQTGLSEKDNRSLHIHINDFLLKMRDNLVPVRVDGSGVAHYESDKDAVYVPRQKDFEHYNDYVQEVLRQVVSATGHQQRLAREGMVMKDGKVPSEDAVKQERLIVELASGIKMMELGLPARLSTESLRLVDYWNRELKENPNTIDAIESDVNNALDVIKKAERGEKIVYSSDNNRQQTAEMQDELPKHFFIADEIKQHPNPENKTIVPVIDQKAGAADVILPSGASLKINNEVPGMSKQRIEKALRKEGIENVRFFNPDGALGYRPDDSYFAEKKIAVAKLRNWSLEELSVLDASVAVQQANVRGFEQIQMVQDNNNRWALYIKPEGKEAFSVYPDKNDLNRFFSTLKQAQATMNNLRKELAEKYYTMAEVKPELKVDLFGPHENEQNMNRIQKVNIFKAKNDVILCAATIEGADKVQPRVVSPSQWQRFWLAEDKDSYKKNLAANLFADVLQQTRQQADNSHGKESKQAVEQSDSTQEKEEKRPRFSANALKQWDDLKAKHPDAMLLIREGDFYTLLNQDATKGTEILGLSLQHTGKNDTPFATFPYHTLDTYLPKLIRFGARVAICDSLEEPQKRENAVRNETEQQSKGIRR